jgi:hypothetical protein
MKSLLLSLLLVTLCNGSGVLNSKFLSHEVQAGAQCSDANLGTFQLTTFDVNPWPPARAVDLMINFVGIHNQATTVVSLDFLVKYNGIDYFNMSDYASGSFQAGQQQVILSSIFLPPASPAGNYEVYAKLKDINYNYLNCWVINFSL